jgi:pimeloyl-ACP methyl ester carboxylesterase
MTPSLNVTHHFAAIDDVMIHYVMSGPALGAAPVVVLLHGWPQTWYEWRLIIPGLADRYTVIAPDLRGLGDSSRPLTGYDKKTVANDIWRVLNENLKIDRFFLVGHDWGGPTAYALTAAHREAVRRLAILDVTIPGCGGDFSQGGRRWHHQFHITPDLPEALTQGREDVYLAWFYRTFAYRPDAVGPEDLKEYVRTYAQPGGMRAGFGYYRAMMQDVADNKLEIAKGKLTMPVLAMGGAVSYPHGRGRGPECGESLKRVAVDVRAMTVPECGHFIPEEQPEFLLSELLAFFGEEKF